MVTIKTFMENMTNKHNKTQQKMTILTTTPTGNDLFDDATSLLLRISRLKKKQHELKHNPNLNTEEKQQALHQCKQELKLAKTLLKDLASASKSMPLQLGC